jgi:hypothetical protein
MTPALLIAFAMLALLESVHHHASYPGHWSKRT